MSVLDTYQSEANQFYWGQYLGRKDKAEFNQMPPRQFRYEIVSPKDKRYLQLVQNLISHDGSIVIKTTWDLGFENQGVVMDADGDRHLISNMQFLIEEEEAQVNAIIKNAHKTYYMELT